MRALMLLVAAGLVSVACRPADDPLVTHRLLAMATWIDIRLPQSATTRERELIAVIEAELRQFEVDYYAWGDGELAALNRTLTAQRQFEASPAMAALLTKAREVTKLTDGAFDPGIGELVELWGFNGAEPGLAPPAAETIRERLRNAGSILDLEITGTRIEVSHSRALPDGLHFTLDLGGIAKGAAVDMILEHLETRGVAPALINAGGDLRVIGTPSERDWRIGIAAPRDDGILGTIRLLDHEAAFTSGDYERFYEHAGSRFHHILDPGTGFPAEHTQAVTVIADNGTLADAAATALFVAGPDDWRSAAAALGIEAALRVDGSGRVEMTPAMSRRFEASAEASFDIMIAAD